MANQSTVYMTDATKAALRRIAEIENLRSPRGDISLSAAVRWLTEEYDRQSTERLINRSK